VIPPLRALSRYDVPAVEAAPVKILQHRDVLSVVLAGGMGERLFPLTRDRAKPAVPFGGRYRIIDFVLNNFVNSGLTKVKVLTQFKSNSLIEHIVRTWRLTFDIGQFVDPVPAQMRRGPHWFRGTADAVYQNLDLVFDEEPSHVCVFGGDHVYVMDVNPMLAFHEEGGHDLTIAALPVALEEATRFGILEVGDDGRILGFEEKPSEPRAIPGHPDLALASMGNYIFRASVLIEALEHDALQDTSHDFGKNLIPALLKGGARLFAYDFSANRVPGNEDLAPYWRDVGTVDSYWDASMDLISVTPPLNLYNQKWPIKSLSPQLPPAKFVFADAVSQRIGLATDSLVAPGSIISGGTIHRSILFPRVRINSFSHVEECVLMDGVDVGRYARLKRVIADKGVQIPPRIEIGFDLEEDRKRFHVSEGGVVVLPKGAELSEPE
jgi:glucose-1-phosphate adenylyltransferase